MSVVVTEFVKRKLHTIFFSPVAALSISPISLKIFHPFFSFYATICMPLHSIDYKRYFVNLRKYRASGTCLIMSKSRPSIQSYNRVELSPLQADSCSDINSTIACFISHCVLRNEVSMTCYLEMTKDSLTKRPPNFPSGYCPRRVGGTNLALY